MSINSMRRTIQRHGGRREKAIFRSWCQPIPAVENQLKKGVVEYGRIRLRLDSVVRPWPVREREHRRLCELSGRMLSCGHPEQTDPHIGSLPCAECHQPSDAPLRFSNGDEFHRELTVPGFVSEASVLVWTS